MIRVFVDASVLFAACYSQTGSSRDLIRGAIRDRIQIVVSRHALKKVRESNVLGLMRARRTASHGKEVNEKRIRRSATPQIRGFYLVSCLAV